MNRIKRFEEAIRWIGQSPLDEKRRIKKLASLREAIEIYGCRLNEAYVASQSSRERSLFREAADRLRMLIDEIRVLSNTGAQAASGV